MTVQNFVDLTVNDIFTLMIHQDFVCGFIFDFCGADVGEKYYDQLYLADYQTTMLANKPTSGPVANNRQLEYFYELAAADEVPGSFSVLWLSDIELDLDYSEGSSTNCADFACCHAKDKTDLDSEKASKYGSRNCYHSLDGYKRMIDAINYFNTSAMPIKSIISGGGLVAPVPETITETRTKEANKEVISYLRTKNPFVGLYNSLGPFDLYPPNY